MEQSGDLNSSNTKKVVFEKFEQSVNAKNKNGKKGEGKTVSFKESTELNMEVGQNVQEMKNRIEMEKKGSKLKEKEMGGKEGARN